LAWCILDEKARDAVGWDFSKLIQKRKITQGGTIKKLAEKVNIEADGLEATVQNWNKYAARGKDPEWGRERSYIESFKPIKTPPYYATPIDIYLIAGFGPGLKINTKAQVVTIDQKPVKRLYATGADSSGVMPSMYIGCGSALSIGFLFGRIAGRNAAAEKPCVY
jgi:succinate dehydrogenase/fumarate reductase flavoprotein subunit